MEKITDELVGSILAGRYQILEEVGKGRIGVVFKAIDERLGRTVAIKLLYQDVTGNETGIARFEREARATGCLSHPNIVTLFDFGLSEDNYPYLVMEFLEGVNLQDFLDQEGGKMSVERTIQVVSQICSALGHAHNRGVLHRDLKPSNIMLIETEGFPDFVKLVDFGIAKRFDMDDDDYERLTMEGQIIGTPAYMSPEQCQAKDLDVRSDVYSLGCVLFKCLTGAAPYIGTGLLEVMQAHIHRAPLRFEDIEASGEVPRELKHIVYQALAKQPEQRQQSMTEVRFQLMQVLSVQLRSNAGSVAQPMQDVITAERERYNPDPADTGGIEQLTEQAQTGDPKAKYLLSIRYEAGEGLPQNKAEASRYLRAAADGGCVEAQFKLARQLLGEEAGSMPSPAAAVVWFQRAADQGYSAAQFSLGSLYESGNGVQMDLVHAVKYYRQAAIQGHKQAEQQLAACYRMCLQYGLQPEGFVEWMQGKANEGDVNALYGMGCYLKSNGGAQSNTAEAISYMQQAAHFGHSGAQLEMARMLIGGGQADPQSYKDAVVWLTQAAQKGSQEANTLLACCYKNGLGIQADANQAIQLLQKAADSNVLDAQVLLGTALLIGDNAPRSIPRGIAFLKNAAQEGNSCAQWKLALCYKNGMGIMRDTREAEKWFIKSAEGRFQQGLPWNASVPGLRFDEAVATFQALANLDHKQAYYWLGLCLEDGLVVKQDFAKALELYSRAAQKGLEIASTAAHRLRNQMTTEVAH